ncbi:phosphoglycerate kinase [Anaeramoeba flamelloides]|uniref:Phosphoglycerate kinase n=1 Tax=Anaeramoeba flamelloides TaxID=1746091 RepID=A0AAV8A7N1_9EUKA|nr:phosphoglycerate kinase [Anaeramoeba flamelloides]KAJ6236495.1 phosphoglycerate kinase [Anaeramoeba flamelloides]
MSLSNKLSITDLDLKGKRVLIRCDYNVPLDKETGAITDPNRITATLPTLKYIMEKGARSLVLMSHLGRPSGRVVPKLSLRVVAEKLSELLEKPVTFLENCVGEKVEKACAQPEEGSIFLLENLRFHKEEEGKGKDEEGNVVKATEEETKKFRASLSKLGDVFINDAFGTAHRAHSSMVGVNLPQRASGFLLTKELTYFAKALEKPTKPYLAILGGKKVSDKILLIKNLLAKVDEMIICGAMAFTFKKFIDGVNVGKSICENDKEDLVKEIVVLAKKLDVKLHFPIDHLCADNFDNNANTILATDEEGINENYMGLDCGPKTSEIFKQVILRAKTIVMNGMPGVFELPTFAKGTISLVNALAESTSNGAATIVCGGDSSASVKKFGKSNEVSHMSTGGGASIELLEGKVLPGVAALSNKEN